MSDYYKRFDKESAEFRAFQGVWALAQDVAVHEPSDKYTMHLISSAKKYIEEHSDTNLSWHLANAILSWKEEDMSRATVQK